MKKSTIAAIIIALVVAGGFFLAKSGMIHTTQLRGLFGGMAVNDSKIRNFSLNPTEIYPTGFEHEANLPTETEISFDAIEPLEQYEKKIRVFIQQEENGRPEILHTYNLNGTVWNGRLNGATVSPSEINTSDTEDSQEWQPYVAWDYVIVLQWHAPEPSGEWEEQVRRISVLPGVRQVNSIENVRLSKQQISIQNADERCPVEAINIEWNIVGSSEYQNSFYVIKAKKQGTNEEKIINREKYDPGEKRHTWCGTTQSGNITAGTYDVWIERYNRSTDNGGRKLETSRKVVLTIIQPEPEPAEINQEEQDQAAAAREEAAAAREEAAEARREAEEARREAEDARRNLQELLNSMASDYCGSILAAYADDEELMNICIESYLQN